MCACALTYRKICLSKFCVCLCTWVVSYLYVFVHAHLYLCTNCMCTLPLSNCCFICMGAAYQRDVFENSVTGKWRERETHNDRQKDWKRTRERKIPDTENRKVLWSNFAAGVSASQSSTVVNRQTETGTKNNNFYYSWLIQLHINTQRLWWGIWLYLTIRNHNNINNYKWLQFQVATSTSVENCE